MALTRIIAQIDELGQHPLPKTIYTMSLYACACGEQTWQRWTDDPAEPQFIRCTNCGKSADKLFLRQVTR